MNWTKRSSGRQELFAALMCFVGAAVPGGLFASEYLSATRSASFVETRAVITKSERRVSFYEDEDRSRRESHQADIDYDYWVDGQRRSGHGVYFGNPDPTATRSEDIQELLDEYSIGIETHAYYDPHAPNVVCLRAGEGTGGSWSLAAFSAFCVLIGVGLLVRWKRRHS